MTDVQNLSSDEIVQKIKARFVVPERVRDRIRNVVDKTRGGYILLETRPRWDGSSGPWTRSVIAKIIFHKPSGQWKVYWMRASGKWELYGEYKLLGNALKAIQIDKYGCFWG